MKRLFVLAFAGLGLFATSAAGSTGWTDITAAPYVADYQCTSGTDDGPAINQALSDASSAIATNHAGGWVIYFPPGCYNIKTQIVDTVTSGGITCLGFGRVELSAVSGLSGSVMKLGDDTHAVGRRRLSNFYVNCNSLSGIDGIQIDGLKNSELDDVEIQSCSSYGFRSVGTSTQNYSNVFEGGGISTSTASANGIYLGYGANNWTLKGTRIINSASSPTGIGLEFEGSGNVCDGCGISGWGVGLATSQTSLSQASDGLAVNGGYFENNTGTHIRLGLSGVSGAKIHGASINGVYLHANGGASSATCIDVQQADGFSITGNQFLDCVTYNIRVLADGTNQGGDNGTITGNSFNGSATNSLLGTNISLISGGQLMQINSTSNCSSSVNPAACGSDASGSVVIAAGSNSVTVDTTAVTANSQILVTFDSSLGSKLGVTCNTTFAAPLVSARTAGTSFNIAVVTAPSTHPACFSYTIIN